MSKRLLIAIVAAGALWSTAGYASQVERNTAMIYSLRQQVAQMKEEIEGIRSLLESLSRKVGSRPAGADAKALQALRSRIDGIDARLSRIEKAAMPARPANQVPSATSPKGSDPKTGAHTPPSKSPVADPLEKAKSRNLYSRGVRLVAQGRYAEAKRRFTILSKRKYKPAATQFYLGEIAYRTGHYADAIKAYQKSAERNENAAYMDRLLLHAGIALEKIGEKRQAKEFYRAVIDGYPGTTSAREAKKRLHHSSR
ncbi:tetratricopeptide repeat protein [Nitratifractor sp.]